MSDYFVLFWGLCNLLDPIGLDFRIWWLYDAINYWRVGWRISIVNLSLHKFNQHVSNNACLFMICITDFCSDSQGYYGKLQLNPLFQESLHSHSLPNDSIRQNKFQVPKNQEVGLENQGVELCQTYRTLKCYILVHLLWNT